jgi:GDP-D-mannose 3',5'-epimerase
LKQTDLRWLENCLKACEGCDEVYNLAADMGGMGFIGTNNHVLFIILFILL